MAEWSAIVGEKAESASVWAWRVARALSLRGFSVGGFVLVPACAPTGEVIGTNIQRVLGEETCPLMPQTGAALEESAFERAAGWVREPNRDFVLIDGVGSLEEARGGHWPVLGEAIAASQGPHVILVALRSSLSIISLALPPPLAELVVPAAERRAARYVDALYDWARGPRSIPPHSGVFVRAGAKSTFRREQASGVR